MGLVAWSLFSHLGGGRCTSSSNTGILSSQVSFHRLMDLVADLGGLGDMAELGVAGCLVDDLPL